MMRRTRRRTRLARMILVMIHQFHSTLGQWGDSGWLSSSSFLTERDRKEEGEAEYSRCVLSSLRERERESYHHSLTVYVRHTYLR